MRVKFRASPLSPGFSGSPEIAGAILVPLRSTQTVGIENRGHAVLRP
jgi:hypothetical protein